MWLGRTIRRTGFGPGGGRRRRRGRLARRWLSTPPYDRGGRSKLVPDARGVEEASVGCRYEQVEADFDENSGAAAAFTELNVIIAS